MSEAANFRKVLKNSIISDNLGESKEKVIQDLETTDPSEISAEEMYNRIENLDLKINPDQRKFLAKYADKLENSKDSARHLDKSVNAKHPENKMLSLKGLINNLNSDIERAIGEERSLLSISKAVNDKKLARDANKSYGHLKKLSRKLKDLSQKEEHVEEYMQTIKSLEERLGSMVKLEARMEMRKQVVQKILDEAKLGEESGQQGKIVRKILQNYDEVQKEIKRFEQEIYNDIEDNIAQEDLTGKRIVTIAPTLKASSKNNRELSILGFLLLLLDVKNNNRKCREYLDPENDKLDVENEEARKKLFTAYNKLDEINENEFEILDDYPAYYVRPEEFDADDPEIVISTFPEEYNFPNDLPNYLANIVELRKIDSDNTLPATLSHELTHWYLDSKTDFNLMKAEKNNKVLAEIDEGTSYAITYLILGESFRFNKRSYINEDVRPDRIRNIAEKLVEKEARGVSLDKGINKVRQRGLQLIKTTYEGKNTLQKYLNT